MSACTTCGACCVSFRVDFSVYEYEEEGGSVPAGLASPITEHTCRMRGTDHSPPRCAALYGKTASKPCAASANGAPPLAVNLPKAVKLANAQGNDKGWRLWAEAGCTVAQLHSCISSAKEGECADWVSNF